MIGRFLSHYRILERLGRRGMGEALVAEDTTLERKVALKILPEHHADIAALGRLCDVYQIPFATNGTTAEAVLDYLDAGPRQRERANPALEKYQTSQRAVLDKGA